MNLCKIRIEHHNKDVLEEIKSRITHNDGLYAEVLCPVPKELKHLDNDICRTHSEILMIGQEKVYDLESRIKLNQFRMLEIIDCTKFESPFLSSNLALLCDLYTFETGVQKPTFGQLVEWVEKQKTFTNLEDLRKASWTDGRAIDSVAAVIGYYRFSNKHIEEYGSPDAEIWRRQNLGFRYVFKPVDYMFKDKLPSNVMLYDGYLEIVEYYDGLPTPFLTKVAHVYPEARISMAHLSEEDYSTKLTVISEGIKPNQTLPELSVEPRLDIFGRPVSPHSAINFTATGVNFDRLWYDYRTGVLKIYSNELYSLQAQVTDLRATHRSFSIEYGIWISGQKDGRVKIASLNHLVKDTGEPIPKLLKSSLKESVKLFDHSFKHLRCWKLKNPFNSKQS